LKTSQLIDLLSQGSGPAPRLVVPARLGLALALGLAVSAAISSLALGLNPDLATMGAALALKLLYVAGLTAGAVWLTARLARPGATWGGALSGVVLVFGAMCVLALTSWGQADAMLRDALFFGQSWTTCPWRVAALSLPALLLGFLALRGLAPTHLRLAGAAVGLMAGGLGAFGYALHCPELSPLFVVTWYSLGMIVPALVGALLGPRLLQW
jgi:hypothetical protein